MVELKNGSTLILEICTRDGCSIVLASTEKDFVTWWKDDKGDCFCGNYFPQSLNGLKDAVEDLNSRPRV